MEAAGRTSDEMDRNGIEILFYILIVSRRIKVLCAKRHSSQRRRTLKVEEVSYGKLENPKSSN